MNIDKTKFIRYFSLAVFCLGILNKIFSHYGLVMIPDAELDFWAGIVALVSGAVFGITIESNTIKALFSGKSGSL